MSQIENNVSWGKTLGLHRDAHPKCSMLFVEHTALPVAGFSFDETLVRQHLHVGVPFLYLQFPVKDFGNSKKIKCMQEAGLASSLACVQAHQRWVQAQEA